MNSKLLLLLMSIILISCRTTLSDKEIMKRVWKCGQPCGLGDVMVFDLRNAIKNDTIFYNNLPYAKIVQRTYNWDEDVKIAVMNLINTNIKDTCIFHAK